MLQPKADDYAERVATSFAAQSIMATLGISLTSVAPGRVILEAPFAEGLAQQHGFLHAGVVATALDSACGYAAFSLMPADAEVLTAEFKINLLAPARGARFRFEGAILKPGRTLTVAEGRAMAISEAGDETLIAAMTATLMTIVNRPDVRA